MNSYSQKYLKLPTFNCLAIGITSLILCGVFTYQGIFCFLSLTLPVFAGVLLASTLLITVVSFSIFGYLSHQIDLLNYLPIGITIPLGLVYITSLAIGIWGPELGMVVLSGMSLTTLGFHLSVIHLIAVGLMFAILTIVFLLPAISDISNDIKKRIMHHKTNSLKEITVEIELVQFNHKKTNSLESETTSKDNNSNISDTNTSKLSITST